MPGLFENAAEQLRRSVRSRKEGPITGILDSIGKAIYDIGASPSRLVNAHMQEYQPGMSVQDMPQTMKQLPETAMNVVGTPVSPTGVPGISLTSGVKFPPKAIGGYHETWALDDFSKFKPSDHDLGVHFAVDPLAPRAADYAQLYKLDNPKSAETVKPRTMPVVADIQKSLKFPVDAGNWMRPNDLIGAMEHSITRGNTIPLGLLRDTMRAEKEAGGIAKNFIPMLQEKGFDSLYYPHISERYGGDVKKYNTFMALDPKQVMPKFSEEGQDLIKRRGYHAPMADVTGDVYEKWAIPKGILHPYGPNTPNQRSIVQEAINDKTKKNFLEYTGNTKAVKNLQDMYDAGVVSSKEFIETYNGIYGPNHWQNMYGPNYAPKKTQDILHYKPKISKEEPIEVTNFKKFKSGEMSMDDYLASFDKLKYSAVKSKFPDNMMKSLSQEQLKYQLMNGSITKSTFDKYMKDAKPNPVVAKILGM